MYKRNRLLLLVVFLICTGWKIIAQDYYPGSQTHYQMIYEKSSEKYGVTSLLLNGVYFDDPYIGARGHPYLGKDIFRKGTIVFRNKIYSNVLMKYDIDEQRIILNHNHPETRLVTILPNVFIESFKIGDDVFKNASFNGGEKQYYEVVFEGD
ncbi:MAG TPA: hypothetical protein VJ951_07970, partial [Bacteroidales bacterium]|nr:hypothetical protein [Bacteroidales bacterium]